MEGLLCTTGSTTQTDKFSALRDFLSRVTVKDYVTERVVSLERSCQILDEHACSTRQVGVLVISYNDPSWPLHLCWHFVACQTHSFLFVSMLHRVGMIWHAFQFRCYYNKVSAPTMAAAMANGFPK